MGPKRQSINEHRLAKLRVLKEEHFAEELSHEEMIEAKDARIELLEDEVAKLRKRVNQLEERVHRQPRTAPVREEPRSSRRESDAQPRFDFYSS